MPRVSQIWNNFTAGELTPRMRGRVDVSKYANGCEILENFIIQPHGGVERRPGLKFVAEVKDSATATRLIPFVFSQDQSYVLEFGHEYIRFYADHGQIESGGSPYEVATTYQETELAALQFAQCADILYITHQSHPPRKLMRLGHTDWILQEINFRPPPTKYMEHYPAADLTPGATTGTGVTFTTDADAFLAGDVARHIKAGVARAVITTYTSATEVEADILDDFPDTDPIEAGDWYLTLTPSAEVTPSGKKLGASITVSASMDCFRSEDANQYAYINNGVVQILAYGSATSVTALVLKELDDTTADSGWELLTPAWGTDNYPRCVIFFENRAVYAATPENPLTIWFTSTNEFEAFLKGINDNDAIILTISAHQIDAIRWLTAHNLLIVGTPGSEWTLAGGNSAPITPTNFTVQEETFWGSAAVTPVKVGNVVLYVQRAGRKLRELVYVFETDTMAAPDLTLLSSHITQGGVTALVHSKEPYSIVWAVRGDGALLGMTYEREEKVVGWHRHSTDGEIESLAVIPQEDADELWAVVNRTIGGVERRYVEYMTAWTDDMEQEEAFFVDSGLSYSGAPALVFSGLDHLEGQTVHVLADGAVHPACVVTAGQITLEYEASTVHAGLPYTSTLKTMRPEGGSAEGVSQGKTKRLHRAVIRLDRSLGLKVGPDADHLDTVAFREMWDAMDAAPPLFTGDVEIEIDDDYSLEAQIMMQQDLPLPCNILAVMFGLSVHD